VLLARVEVPILEAAGRDRPGEGDLHCEDARQLEAPHGRRVYLVEAGDRLRRQDAGASDEKIVGLTGEEDVEGDPERARVLRADLVGQRAEGERALRHS
jgi:hypothetical protein